MKQKNTIIENRQHPRYEITENPNYVIHFRSSQDVDYSKASTINISKGGIMLSSDVPHRPHARIEIVIFSPNNKDQAIFYRALCAGQTKHLSHSAKTKGIMWEFSLAEFQSCRKQLLINLWKPIFWISKKAGSVFEKPYLKNLR